MFNSEALAFSEWAVGEKLPISTIHTAVLEFLKGRKDVVVYGSQAVNAYIREKRLTEDVDIVSTQADKLGKELSEYLGKRFHIAVRMRVVARGRGLRLFQVQKTGNRHLVDIRPVETLPAARRVQGVQVLEPALLVASKVIVFHKRRGQPKSGTDWRDLAVLLLKFPQLKQDPGPVTDSLAAMEVDSELMQAWRDLVAQDIRRPVDEGY